MIEELYQWDTYLAGLGVEGAGIAIKAQGESVNHMFRYMRRSDLVHYYVKGGPFAWRVDSAPHTTRPQFVQSHAADGPFENVTM